MKFKNLFKELLIVTIGVFIAMLLNSWNEDRKAKNEAKQYLNGICEEMKNNIEVLNEAIPYHQGLLDGLRNDPTIVRLSLNTAQVNNLAWKLSENNTFKNNIDKETYYTIAKIYQQHDRLINIQNEAEKRMSEVNVMSPYYELSVLDVEIDEETAKAFEIKVMQAWIPVFESWTHYEKEYLKLLLATVEDLENATN